MSEEMEQQIKAKMDFFGQLASIFTIPTIIALAYWMHLEILIRILL